MSNEAQLARTSTADIGAALDMSRASYEQESQLSQRERDEIESATTESRKLIYVSAEERMAAVQAQEATSEAHEPALKRPEDLEKWKHWAKAYADLHERFTHPRAYDDAYKPTHRRLPLCMSAREIGRQFGAGVQLYLDLMGLYFVICVLAGGLHAYVTYLNIMSQGVEVWENDEPRAFIRNLPMLLLLTTSGARLDCTEYRCRLATTVTALVDVFLTLVLLVRLPRHLRAYVGRVAQRSWCRDPPFPV